jgi:hypothetical protein
MKACWCKSKLARSNKWTSVANHTCITENNKKKGVFRLRDDEYVKKMNWMGSTLYNLEAHSNSPSEKRQNYETFELVYSFFLISRFLFVLSISFFRTLYERYKIRIYTWHRERRTTSWGWGWGWVVTGHHHRTHPLTLMEFNKFTSIAYRNL